MRLSILDTDELAPASATAWRPGALRNDAGIVFVHGRYLGIVAPTDATVAWILGRFGADAALVSELAGFVYHRKGWFADDLDPLTLRDRRPGQYDLRVFTEVDGQVVPVFAIDLAPVRGRGTWDELDQSAPNTAASILEIGVVPGGQPVIVGGRARLLGELGCTTDRIWEASRLASVTELARTPRRDAEAAVPAFRRVERALAALARLDGADLRDLGEGGRGLFGVCIAWAIARLPIELFVGLSQGTVVPAFTSAMTRSRARVHRPVAVERWHPAAAALAYAPGYFATGQVCGYALDGTQMLTPMLERGLARLARTPVGRADDVLAGLTRSA